MRCDVNISLRSKSGAQGERVELKNVMGIRFIEKAIEHEVRRHADLISRGIPVLKETRRYDAANDTTILLRSKEEDIDYRFLVDPDIPNFRIKQSRIDGLKSQMSPIPFEKKQQLVNKYSMSIVDVQAIYNHAETIPMFESLADEIKDGN